MKAPTAVVIGSGVGGLAAAIRLRQKGYCVKVLERLEQPGGRASVIQSNGYTFDMGPTIITAPFLLQELWAIFGERFEDHVDLRRMDPFYRIRFSDGSHFDYFGDALRMRQEVQRVSPIDLPGYDSFMREAERCYVLGYEELGTVPFNRFSELIAAIPSMMRMRAWESIYAMACRHFQNDKLRQVFSFHPLLIGGNPLSVTCVYSLIAALERRFGVHSAMGGTGKIVREMAALFERHGGEIRYQSDVTQIETHAGEVTGVRMSDGSRLAADIVVSNADAATTYQELLSEHPRRTWTDRKVQRASYSMSLLVWYFGTRRQYPDIPHHMILMGPRYEELLRDIFDRKVLAEDFSLYLHRPTATDPSLAPDGCDAFYVLSPVPHLDAQIDWQAQAEPYRAKIGAALEATVLPGLTEALDASHLVTPNHFDSRYRSFKGAAFGMEPRLLQSAWFRPHNSSEDVRGLYLVGASTHPGAGIPGVLTSAKAFAAMMEPVAA
jgi:phytoene desaturase